MSNLHSTLSPLETSVQPIRNTFGIDYTVRSLRSSPTISQDNPSAVAPHRINTDDHSDNPATTLTTTNSTNASTHDADTLNEVTNPVSTMALSNSPPIPLSAYIALSQVAVSSALKVAMVSTSLSLGVARTIVSGIDKVLSLAMNSLVGGGNKSGSGGLSPAFVASLPFRAALLGINFSDILVQTILETVDGSVNLALNTVQDGLDLMDSLFGPDSTSQTGETFREVWAILSREFTQEGEESGGYPALEGMRLLMAYVAIQFATSDQWETIRVRTQCRLVGECLESIDEDQGSSTAWSAVGDWPEGWKELMNEDEILDEQRTLELREQSEGRHRNTSARVQGYLQATRPSSSSPNPELTNFMAASYRFSRFCSAMYGEMALEFMGAPERYPAHIPPQGQAQSQNTASDHHFHHYTGTPLGSILYSSDAAATVHDGFYSPRYYLLDDVESKQIVLVFRGTKSLHDAMIDLTCDAADLWLDHDTTGSNVVTTNYSGTWTQRKRPFKVHGGFLKAARTIAAADTIGIQEKVKDALESRPDYCLLIIGHSLGAGIASILSMLWADPATGLTPETPGHHLSANNGATKASSSMRPSSARSGLGSGVALGLNIGLSGVSSAKSLRVEEEEQFYLPGFMPRRHEESPAGGSSPCMGHKEQAEEPCYLPAGRRVRCYAYGTPQVMCPRMSKRAIKLVTSISYGDDVVGRLSLGTVRSIGHAMRALLAMRPPPSPAPPAPPQTTTPPSPPHSESGGSPPSSPELKPQDVLHDASDTLDQLLEEEGEGLELQRAVSVLDQTQHPQTRGERRQERRQSRREEKGKKRREKEAAKAKTPAAQKSIGLEIVQKVIRWRLTKEDHLLEEFMDIRRAMHSEMKRHQEVYEDDYYNEEEEAEEKRQRGSSKTVPILVPAGKVLWIRPTTWEKELENAETKEHPFESVLHQFEWDHPHSSSCMIPRPISQQLQQHLKEDPLESESIRSLKSTVRSSLYKTPSSSTVSLPVRSTVSITSDSPSLSVSPPSLSIPSITDSRPVPLLHRQPSLDSVRTFATATTTGATFLHPTAPPNTAAGTPTSSYMSHGQGGNTDKLIYRMYSTPEPEHVFDEMLFSRRMWSDHLPLTYEFILAGKHAIPVTSFNTENAATAETGAKAAVNASH
ncbi:hypothetical protein BGZ83_001472 [Gryganskiella cystojenkinii]|nr:hypothetical protein BGZ83_001472 [Gryganskiella cystojenkinii]